MDGVRLVWIEGGWCGWGEAGVDRVRLVWMGGGWC